MPTSFALIPMGLGLTRGSEAGVALGRAVPGGLLARLVTNLVVVPCVYSLLVHDRLELLPEPLPGEHDYRPGRPVAHADGHTPEELRTIEE